MSATGGIAFVTQSGPVDLILDITATSFRAPMSTQDAQGVDGPRGLSAWDTIPSGQTVTDNWGTSNQYSAAFGIVSFSVPLPAKASTALTAAQVNFAPGTPSGADIDATCTGTAAAPTAPPGKICPSLYGSSLGNATRLQGAVANNANTQAFYVSYAVVAPAPGRRRTCPSS